MSFPSRERDREQLGRELETGEYQRLLHDLHRRNPFLRQFRTWTDVIAFMRKGTSQDPRKDEILRPIFQAHAKDGDSRWRTILMIIFLPALESIDSQKRYWDPDPNERWQTIVWVFLRMICRVDVNKRPHRLVQKVFNDTVHHLYDEYLRAWDYANHEIPTDPLYLEALAGGVEDIGYSLVDLRKEQEAEVRRLRGHKESGRITEADFLLLIGTRVYGRPIADYARDTGLAYQLVKKRRQRAETAIRNFEREKL